jgi:inner membrane transporter RhtA
MAPGVALMILSGVSNQAGAALGAHAFPAIGPAGVVAMRQFAAAAILLPVARPKLFRFTWQQWWPTLCLGVVFSVMNLALYTSIERIGLGLAVTLEFLGPLAVALAGSRTRIDLLCAFAAGGGVLVLCWPGPTSDYLGVALALLAGACWAGYILLNRLVGKRIQGIQAPAAATLVSAVIYLPVAVVLAVHGRFGGVALLYAACAGVLATAVPYAADVMVLRWVRPQFFGVFMSINPVLAAFAGMVLLGQQLNLREWLGVLIVVGTNAVAMSVAARRRPVRPATGTPAELAR